jgi:hypothetical protein
LRHRLALLVGNGYEVLNDFAGATGDGANGGSTAFFYCYSGMTPNVIEMTPYGGSSTSCTKGCGTLTYQLR